MKASAWRTDPIRPDLFELVAVHSLTWLFVGSAVGMLLATLLLLPGAGALLGAWTYGRWVPLHLDLELYGWCGLPLVGLLFRLFLPDVPGRMPRLAVGLWSGSLLFGAFSWLSGHSSGKIFLEWSGAARGLLLVNLVFLGLTLLVGFARQTERRGGPRSLGETGGFLGKTLFLLVLLALPFVLYWAAGPEVYPPINPDSGGATGTSLMGSTLGIVALLVVCPWVLGMRSNDRGRTTRQSVALLVAHLAWFAGLDHGDRSNHEIIQVLSLSSLVVWLPLLIRHLRRFAWPEVSRRWLGALCAWGVLLLATGVVTFLPGMLESFKFTHVLVAHAHVAMGGLATSLTVLILIALTRETRQDLFTGWASFFLWQGGSLLLMASLLVLGVVEASNPGILFRDSFAVTVLFLIRWLAGGMMLTAAGSWLWDALGEHARSETLATVACES